MKNFMTKEQFYDSYNVFEYGHKLGHQIMAVGKEDNMIRYIDEGEDLDSLYNEMFFNMNVVNYVNANDKKYDSEFDLDEFYFDNFESWYGLADIFGDHLIQMNYMRDQEIFRIVVRGKNKEEYNFSQTIDGNYFSDILINPSEEKLKDTINEFLLRYIGNKAMKWEISKGGRN